MNEEENNNQREWADEMLATVQRYEKVNDKIDAYKVRKGILPQFIVHGGEYATLYLHPEFDSKWRGTFYDKERMFLATTLQRAHSLSKYHYFVDLGKRQPCTFWIIGYCDSAASSDEGVRIHLTDPYGEVLLPPFYHMPADLIVCYVGKMLLTRLSFTYDGPVLHEVVTLPFTLTERITEGHPLYESLTEPPFDAELDLG